MNIFAQRMRELRQEKKRTQTQMAELIGIKLRAYQNYDRGLREPQLGAFVSLADFYHITVDELICHEKK